MTTAGVYRVDIDRYYPARRTPCDLTAERTYNTMKRESYKAPAVSTSVPHVACFPSDTVTTHIAVSPLEVVVDVGAVHLVRLEHVIQLGVGVVDLWDLNLVPAKRSKHGSGWHASTGGHDARPTPAHALN